MGYDIFGDPLSPGWEQQNLVTIKTPNGQSWRVHKLAARRAMLTQKYGMRIGSLLNVLDEAENEDPVLDAVQEDR